MRKSLCLLLALLLLAGLAACGKTSEAAPEEALTGELRPGWVPTEFPFPEGLRSEYAVNYADGRIYLSARRDGEPLISVYDTLTDTWSELRFDQAGLGRFARVGAPSIAEGTLWALLNTDSPSGQELLRVDLSTGAGRRMPVDFKPGGNSESMSRSFAGVFALSRDEALLYDWDNAYRVDGTARLLETIPGLTELDGSRAGEMLYTAHNGGARPLDLAALRYGSAVDLSVSRYVSDRGNVLCDLDAGRAVGIYDPASGEIRRLFSWIDVALDMDSLGGGAAFENEKGEIWYPAERGYVRLTEGLLSVKKELVLASHGYDSQYADQILYFNHTDPEYKITVRRLEDTEGAAYDRQMIELATQGGVDLLDTSLLPGSALDGRVLENLLPYLDADPEIGREDFIQPLLRAMLRRGGLYEIQPRFTLVTMATHASLFPGRESWTYDAVERLAAEHPEYEMFFAGRDRKVLLDAFLKMATAEYVDYDRAVCDFENESFRRGLRFVRDLPEPEGTHAALLISQEDAAGGSFLCRRLLEDEGYVYCGFPETSGNGSCFMRLGAGGTPYDESTGGFIRLGMMAGSEHKEAAWRFLKLLLTRTEQPVDYGIPVLRSAFEDALARSVEIWSGRSEEFDGYEYFTEGDAERLRELVYGTEKLVHDDAPLLEILNTEARLYFEGAKTLDEAAASIQSRAGLYVAEQYG